VATEKISTKRAFSWSKRPFFLATQCSPYCANILPHITDIFIPFNHKTWITAHCSTTEQLKSCAAIFKDDLQTKATLTKPDTHCNNASCVVEVTVHQLQFLYSQIHFTFDSPSITL
jgi:hypothetical protein